MPEISITPKLSNVEKTFLQTFNVGFFFPQNKCLEMQFFLLIYMYMHNFNFKDSRNTKIRISTNRAVIVVKIYG